MHRWMRRIAWTMLVLFVIALFNLAVSDNVPLSVNLASAIILILLMLLPKRRKRRRHFYETLNRR